MCGIAGVYNFSGKKIREADLTAMRETLVHRGPDEGRTWISPSGNVGLTQRRLAIIDLRPEAACPMANADQSLWITWNGEIYNFKELRAELTAKGYKFKTEGDTEVILYGYEEYGEEIVKKLNGMFAFAIWDAKKKLVFAARDHAGVKPFYYAIQDGAFYFASEIKAILAHPDFKKELQESNISYYLAFSAMPAPHTLFRDIKKLPAAHSLTIDGSGNITIKEFWNPLRSTNQVPENATEEQYIARVRDILKDSIKMQMVSDVPFGCLLSGGIDSSLNAALMSAALGKPVETFTVGAKTHEEKYNEFEYSRKVADKLGAKKHERLVDFEDFMAYLPEYGKYADDPNGDQTNFLVYYLAELVRKSGVTVIQTGEGGDELFAGYESYARAAALYPKWKQLETLPRWMRAISSAVARITGSDFSMEYARRLHAGEEPFWGHAIAFTPLMKTRLLSPKHRKDPAWFQDYEIIAAHYKKADELAPGLDFVNRVAYLELKTRLADFLLMRVDKMGMAHSVEARVPFLDYRLIELTLRIPQNLKLKNGTLKYILKEAARGIIPDEVIDRKKQGFGAPIEEWFRHPQTSKPLMDKIYNSKLTSLELFDYGYVEELAKRHAKGENHAFRLMNLLTLSLWYDYWFEK